MTNRRKRSKSRAAVVTLGCPMNQVDSERIMGGLIARGFEIVPEHEADIVVVNTCAFIGDAREESVETILDIAGLKHTGRLKSLVVAGCLAERYRTELERNLEEADAVLGLADRGRIADVCRDLAGLPRIAADFVRVVSGPTHTAYLKIAEGCSHRCTFCAIPAIRGPFGSIPADDIVRDATDLVSLGARELVLIAQDTTAYGSDTGDTDLAGLLERLGEIGHLDWIRLMYTHPALFNDRLVTTIADIPAVLPYVDVPLQHIAGNVLRRMGRSTPPGDIRRLVERLRARVPGMALRTALIVGFPGETEKDFEELLAFVEETRFERLGAFVYSPEEGTPAASFEDAVPEEIAHERYATLMELQAGIAAAFNDSLVGREFDVIIDEIDTKEGSVTGRTYMDAPEVDGTVTTAGVLDEDKPFVRVRITGAETYDLHGELLPE